MAAQSQDYERWVNQLDCQSLAEIKQLGVRYLIVDDSMTNLLRCLHVDLSGPNRRLADGGRLSVYEFI